MTSSDLPYGPVAPKFAQLDAQERHLYTFGIQMFAYTGFWESVRQTKVWGWHPDHARFIFHLTDKRILIDPYEVTKNEGLMFKGLVVFAAIAKVVSGAGTGGLVDDPERVGDMLSKPSAWFAIPHTEIASVEKIVPMLSPITLVMIAFKSPAATPLAFEAQAAQARFFTTNKCYSKEFIELMGQILGRM